MPRSAGFFFLSCMSLDLGRKFVPNLKCASDLMTHSFGERFIEALLCARHRCRWDNDGWDGHSRCPAGAHGHIRSKGDQDGLA